jgi:hypothetical protein
MNVIDQMAARKEPATLTRIRNGSGISRDRTDKALERLRLKTKSKSLTCRSYQATGRKRQSVSAQG